jgi:hypothetical protein
MAGLVMAAVLTLTMTARTTAEQDQDTQQEFAADAQEVRGGEHSRRFAREAARIEGVWEAQVTRRACATGEPLATFRGMTNFITGGALIGTNSNPNPPTTYGRWQYLGRNRYLAVERLFRFAPDGSFSGVQRITRHITLAPGGFNFTGNNTSEVFDTAGNLISTGCSTDITRRVE